jgi:alpha-N-arabinofuranosidase
VSALIKVDPARKLGEVDPRIYGGFIEHLGRCIYGGIFDEDSELSDEQGFRRDVMEAVCDLGLSVLRWPGGLFASGYHWVDGIGPRDARPRRLDLAWRAEESNRFGTDEFLQYCRRVDAEPVICVNMGTGTIEEAAAWVEYCNGAAGTYWAGKRRANGFDAPHGVRYWCLGNEAYNRQAIGTLGAEDYVKRAVEFAKVMKMADPAIQLIGSGLNGWSRWDRVVLEGLAPFVDFHSVHLYSGSADYYSNVFGPHLAERAVRACQGVIEGVRYQRGIKHPIHIAYDEWNVWFRAGTPPWDQWVASDGGLEERYTLADALAVATYLNAFVRYCPAVRMANIAQVVNVLAPILTSAEGIVRQTIFHPLRLFSCHMRGDSVDVHVECDAHELHGETSPWPHRVADMGPFKVLDVTSVRDRSGVVNLAVVNRELERDVPARIEVPRVSGGSALELNAPSVETTNSFDCPDAVNVIERSLPEIGPSFAYTFPAHSLTMLRLAQETAG